jgi:hypothetical protein
MMPRFVAAIALRASIGFAAFAAFAALSAFAAFAAFVAFAASATSRPAPVTVVVVAPPPADRVVRVTSTEIRYRGQVVETVEGAMCPDAPCFRIDGLSDALADDRDRGRTIRVELASEDIPPIVTVRLLHTIRAAGDDALVTFDATAPNTTSPTPRGAGSSRP